MIRATKYGRQAEEAGFLSWHLQVEFRASVTLGEKKVKLFALTSG